MQTKGAGAQRGIYVVQDSDLIATPAKTTTVAPGGKEQRFEFDVDAGQLFPRPRSWSEPPIQILRANEEHQKELAADPKAFVEYVNAALDANAKFFLPEKPTTPMSRERIVFGHRMYRFLAQSVELARKLYPDPATRDVGYRGIDVAVQRLFDAIYGPAESAWRPQSPVDQARGYDDTMRVLDGLINAKPWAELAAELGDRAGAYIFPHITDSPAWWQRMGMEPLTEAEIADRERQRGPKILILDMCAGLDNVKALKDRGE